MWWLINLKNMVDIKKAEVLFRKNGHTIPVKKGSRWGLRGTSRYNSSNVQVVWENLIQYLYDRGIHDYRFLLEK